MVTVCFPCHHCLLLAYRNAHIATVLPSFTVPPNPFFGPDGSVDIDSHNFARLSDSPPPQKSVGLLEPKNNFLHHGLVLTFI
jgi:hypothetical protein